MIARLTVQRGELTEFPMAERTKNGWQNGVTFYADEQVTAVSELQVCTVADSDLALADKKVGELEEVLASERTAHGKTAGMLSQARQKQINAEAVISELRAKVDDPGLWSAYSARREELSAILDTKSGSTALNTVMANVWEEGLRAGKCANPIFLDSDNPYRASLGVSA